MKRILAAVMLVLSASLVAAQQPPSKTAQEVRERLEPRYNAVPIGDGIALTPKGRRGDVRLIEISDMISINGVVVTGGELRQQVGSDADAILRLSYMTAEERRAFAEQWPREAERSREPAAVTPPPDRRPQDLPRRTRAHGDRVRIFGNVRVAENEEVSGQAVAVFGSAYIDGEVGDQVVAVMGSVILGPKAVVRGDIVSVGGRVQRAATSQVRGGVTEVALSHIDFPDRAAPWLTGVGLFSLADGFGAVPRLIGSTFRLLLMVIMGVLAYVIARRSVENSAARVQDDPLKATAIGMISGILIGPLLFVTCIVLVLTIIGIPLLILVPFVILFLILLALVGFSGTAYAIGQWASRRFGFGPPEGIGAVVVGVVLILLPLMLARVVALGGWAAAPFAFIIGAAAFGLEFLVWSAGFGAILTNVVGGWRARRTAAVPPASAVP